METKDHVYLHALIVFNHSSLVPAWLGPQWLQFFWKKSKFVNLYWEVRDKNNNFKNLLFC